MRMSIEGALVTLSDNVQLPLEENMSLLLILKLLIVDRLTRVLKLLYENLSLDCENKSPA